MNANVENHVLHFKGVFSEHADFYNRLRDEVEWKTIQWKTRPLPRLCCHSVQKFDVGVNVIDWLQIFCVRNLGVNVNIIDVFGNYYRDGNDHLPQHRDAYSTDGIKSHVVSISFGASRRFHF